jgi:hypothetical protein
MDYLILAGAFFVLYLISLAFAKFVDVLYESYATDRRTVKDPRRSAPRTR